MNPVILGSIVTYVILLGLAVWLTDQYCHELEAVNRKWVMGNG